MAVYGQYAQRMLARTGGIQMDAAEPDAWGHLQACLDELLAGTKPVHILDAGCGKNRPIPIATDSYIVGVDISERQLARNDALDEIIVGDIQTCDLGRCRFDTVVCWDVLEHVECPEKALVNFLGALKPGGVLVVVVPHAASIKGLVTRFTPHWFHTWMGRLMTGRDHHSERFPTVMSPSITPKRLSLFARDHALTVRLLSEYEGWEQKKLRAKLKLTGRAFRAIEILVRTLSFGTITVSATDAIIVMQKPR
jgi:SAM-dependent methyltransferase